MDETILLRGGRERKHVVFGKFHSVVCQQCQGMASEHFRNKNVYFTFCIPSNLTRHFAKTADFQVGN